MNNPKTDHSSDRSRSGETPREQMHPCAECGTLRTKAEGGTVFTVCDECWNKAYPRCADRPAAASSLTGRNDDDIPIGPGSGYDDGDLVITSASSLTGPQTPREPFRSDRDATCDWNCTKPYPHDGPCGAAEVVVNPLHEAGQQARASLPTLLAAAGVTGETPDYQAYVQHHPDCQRNRCAICGGREHHTPFRHEFSPETDCTCGLDQILAADPAPPVSGPLDNRPMTQDNELRILRHEHALIEAQTQRGITDCSTPLHIRVQNIVEQLEKAEAQLAALAEQQRRYENAQCITCAQDLDAHSSAALPDAPMRQLIETWREKAKRMEADAEDAQRDANVSIVHPYAWEASRLNDCANELEALLSVSEQGKKEKDNAED